MSKKERFMHVSAVFVAALMLLAPLGLCGIFDEGGGAYENGLLLSDSASVSGGVDIEGVTYNSVSNEFSNESGEVITGTTFLVHTVEGLKNLFTLVENSGSSLLNPGLSGYTIYLMNDIDLSVLTEDWTPIGKDSSIRFNGTFDGQGFEISNLTIDESNPHYAGLFGYIGSKGVVKNVGVVDTSISISTSSTAYAGGIAGSNCGIIQNCYNTGAVTASSNTSNAYAGGIAGSSGIIAGSSGIASIENCYNTGDVSVADTTSNAYAGGIAGEIYGGGTIQNCYNTGDVTATATSNAYAGGIAGWNYGTIRNCYNTGNVTVKDSSIAYAGGIAGSNNATISNCYNTGDVDATASSESSHAYAGGIAGWNEGAISNCYNTGDVTASSTSPTAYAGGIAGSNNVQIGTAIIHNCYNTGDVTASSTSPTAYAGGIAGENFGENVKIDDCYYLKETANFGIGGTQSDETSKVCEKTDADMKLPAFITDLGGNTHWSLDIFGVNNGYPVLADTPISIILGNSVPHASVYLTLNDEHVQSENYLATKLVSSDGASLEVKHVKTLNECSGIDISELIPSYKWFKLLEPSDQENMDPWKGIDDESSELLSISKYGNGTYYVKITFKDGSGTEYSYSSLSRTVERVCSVTYHSGDDSYVVGPYAFGSTATAINNPFVNEGKKFLGWSTDSQSTSADPTHNPGDSIKLDKDLNLYAIWDSYNLYYYSLNGEIDTVSLDDVTHAKDAPSKEGYTFNGWIPYDSNTGALMGENIAAEADLSFTDVNSDIIMVADWTKSGGSTSIITQKQYSVIYVSNDNLSELPYDSNLYTSGREATILKNDLNKEGYISNGWNTKADGTGTQYKEGDKVKINSNLILFAQFTQEEKKNVTVTFVSDNATYTTVTVEEGTSLGNKLPSNPEKENFTFEGWYTDEELTIKFDNSSKISTNVTLYAKWTSSSEDPSSQSGNDNTIYYATAAIITILIISAAAYILWKRR